MKPAQLSEKLLRYRKDTRWVAAGLIFLLVALSAIYYLIQRSRDLPADLATNKVLLLVLWYVNAVLILAIAFMLLRNVVKLLLERYQGIFGSKFRTKLVATYILLSLVPALLLYIYGSSLLRGWIDEWFEQSAFEEVAEQGFTVAQALTEEFNQRTLELAGATHQAIGGLDVTDPGRRPTLDRRLRRFLDEDQAHYLGVYSDTTFVHAVALPQAGFRDLPEPTQRFLLAAQHNGQAQTSRPNGQSSLVLAAIADPQATEPRTIVIAGTVIPAELATAREGLIQARQGYRQLEVQQGAIKTTYRLTFLMVTLLILLATSWVGLYLARRVTVPIEAVAEGTRRLSDGDLDYRVEVPADDELGVLVSSFNSMTTELKRSKEEIVGANRQLAEDRALIEAVLDNVAAGVISVDAQGSVLTCNRAARRMLNQEREEVLGQEIEML